MLKCRDIGHRAGDYSDGNVTWRQSFSFGFHLLLCGHCRTFVRHMRIAIAYAQALPEQETLCDEQISAIVSRAADALEGKS